jgi:GNAT superfamily N-acetyltransferase
MSEKAIEICLIKPAAEKARICREILSALPQWFGIASANAEYIQGVQGKIFYAAKIESKVVGFYALEEHFAQSYEIYLCAVLPQWHGCKIGTNLQRFVEKELCNQGVKYLCVKTLSAQHPDKNYARTRLFYQRMGFLPLQIFPLLWGKDNPCLLMIKEITGNCER